VPVLQPLSPESHKRSARLPGEVSPKSGSKRKAEDDLSTSPRRRFISPSHSFSPPRPPLTASITSLNTATRLPEPSSLNAIIRKHCRARLYVPAIAWTSDQPQLLGCQFVLKKMRSKKECEGSRLTTRRLGSCNVQTDVEEIYATHSRQCQQRHDDLIRAATHLCRSRSMEIKKFAIAELLAAYDIHHLQQPPPLTSLPMDVSILAPSLCLFALVATL
jgi:hypothetical protein